MPDRVPGTMKTAPFNSCIACYRGDTTTAVSIEGEAEFIIAAMHKLAGIPIEEASATFGIYAEDIGCDPGMVPTGRVHMAVRLCAACAKKHGARVVDVKAIGTDKPVFTYAQSEGRDDS